MKKLLSLTLALAMTLSLAMPVVAEGFALPLVCEMAAQ